MTVWQFFILPQMLPFSFSLLLVFGLFLLEIVSLLLGGSLLGSDLDGPDVDGPDLDIPDVDALDIDAADLDAADLAPPDLDAPSSQTPVAAGGLLGWLGVGKVPFLLWLAGLLTVFGLIGYVGQLAAVSLLGTPLHAGLAAALALVPGLWAGRHVAAGLGRLVPKTISQSVSQRHLGGRTGVVTTGTARPGHPAEARVRDRHGNIQYIRVEPADGQPIPQGTEIAVFSGKGPVYPALALDTPPNTDL